jgi:hypothetical protein
MAVRDGQRETACGCWSPAVLHPRSEATRAFEEMMPMKKIDIATLEAARRG